MKVTTKRKHRHKFGWCPMQQREVEPLYWIAYRDGTVWWACQCVATPAHPAAETWHVARVETMR